MASLIGKIVRFRTLLSILSVISIICLILAYLSPFVHPDTLPFLPFLGLAYPIIIIVNFLFAFAWLFISYRWFFVLIAFISLGGKLHFRTFAFGSDDNSEARTELRIMSYNVHLFDLYATENENGVLTKQKIFSYLKKEQPEIVCFQEFYHQDAPTKFVTKDSLMVILSTMDYHERYSNRPYRKEYFGVTILSKYPMINKGELIFSETESTANFCIYVDVIKNQDTFRIYNVHLQSIRLQKDEHSLFEAPNSNSLKDSSNVINMIRKIKNAFPIRANQVNLLARHIKTSPYPVIVCGDFNDTPFSYCYNEISSLLTDAFRNTRKGIGRTYAGKIPAGRIDYIFHSNKLGSRGFEIQNEKLSDHYAIECTVFSKPEKN